MMARIAASDLEEEYVGQPKPALDKSKSPKKGGKLGPSV